MRLTDRRARSWLAVLATSGVIAGTACNSVQVAPILDEEEPTGADASVDGATTVIDGAVATTDAGTDASSATDAATIEEAGTNEGGADAGSDADAGDDEPPPPPPPPPGPLSPAYVDADINHVLVTGQSNAVSNSGDPVLSTMQPYTNVMFDTGVMPMWGRPSNASSPCDGEGCTRFQTPNALVPLVEGDKFLSNFGKETSGAGLANEISYLALSQFEFAQRAGYPQKHDVLVTNHGRSGNTYWCLRKWVAPIANTTNTTCNYKTAYLRPFDQAILEMQNAKALATAAGKSYVVRGAVTIHGESDHYSNLSEFPLDGHDGTPGAVKDYADGLVEWQRDYEASAKEITGQAEPVPLFVVGVSGWTNVDYSKVPVQQLAAHLKAPGKVILVGPAYPLQNANDCLHYSSEGQRHLGEYVAKAYAQTVFGGKPFEPLRPKALSRAGNVVSIQYHVPSPPIVFDTARVAAAPNQGFRVRVNNADVAITNVAIAGDTVQITLAQAPAAGAAVRVWYGMQRIDGNQCIGPTNGPRGNLRDSDPTPSRLGKDLFNWSVQFDELVP